MFSWFKGWGQDKLHQEILFLWHVALRNLILLSIGGILTRVPGFCQAAMFVSFNVIKFERDQKATRQKRINPFFQWDKGISLHAQEGAQISPLVQS